MMKLSYMVMQDVNHQLFAETVLEEVMLGADDSAKQQAVEILQRVEFNLVTALIHNKETYTKN